MATLLKKIVFCGGLTLVLSVAGCSGWGGGESDKEAKAEPNLGPTIGSVASVIKLQPAPVEGYGLVAGLSGTGSAICPPVVRNYLKQYILAQVSDMSQNLDALINSPNTAVVHLEGSIPGTAMKEDRFDVRVTPIVGSDTVSLRGGRLYLAELKPLGTFGINARVLGTVEGPVFTDFLSSGETALKTGYIIGGGRAALDYTGIIRLRQPDFMIASTIRNRVNERYGPDTASAVSGSDVSFKIPAEYGRRKERFLELISATYLTTTAETAAARLDAALRGLADSNDKEASEITLEALGRDSITGLIALQKLPNEEVRLRAARCMLCLHDDRALETLYAIAVDAKSSHRVEALDAIALGARRDDAGGILRRLLGDNDEQVVRAAFEHLRRMKDPTVQEELIGSDFHLDQIPQAKQRAILVFRSGGPRIVLLGTPLICHDNASAESPGGIVTVTAKPGANEVSLVRKSSSRGGRPVFARSSPMVSDIIRTLGADPAGGTQGQSAGLGASYAEIAVLLQRLCEGGAIDAQFWPGPLTKFEQTVKK